MYSQFDDRVPETVTWRHGPWLYVSLGQGRVREARAIVETHPRWLRWPTRLSSIVRGPHVAHDRRRTRSTF